jgi:FAD/FMN-containing dehydrogenase
MVDLQVATISGTNSVLGNEAIEEFRGNLRGRLILPDDQKYDDARKLWNANIDKHPVLIVRCVGVADVIEAVNFARANELLVSVRGGGHSFPGTSVADGGMVIDLTDMNSVRVDPVGRTARAEGGTKWGDLDRETQAFGLATIGGTNSDTGIGGLTLGGGMGWLGGKYGLACDNLVSVDVVTADGQFRTASATENPDLFWAVRGGGGNFGVVTSFVYQLHRVETLLAGMILYPLDQAKAVLKFYHEFTGSMPDEVNTGAAFLNLPDGTPTVAVVACYNGPIEEGEKALRPLREFGSPIADHIGPMSYQEVQHLVDAATPDDHQYYEKSHYFKDLPDEAVDILIDHFKKAPSSMTLPFFQQLGNAANRVPVADTAFGHRDARYNLILISIWEDPGESEIHVKWTRDLWTALEPYSTGGVYINNIGWDGDGDGDLALAAFGPNYRRLSEVKNTYDPTNLFRHNQNIKPMA